MEFRQQQKNMRFSCTSKVLKRLKSANKVTEEKYNNAIDNWYVDQIILERKKYFLFTNSETLFSFFIYFGTTQEIQNFDQIFLNFYMEQITRNFGHNYLGKLKDIQNTKHNTFGKTNSRSILGSMNDFKSNAKYRALQSGLNLETLNSINYYTNQMPMRALNYKSPFEKHKNSLDPTT